MSELINPPRLTFRIAEFAVFTTLLAIAFGASITRFPPPLPQGWVIVAIAVVTATTLGYIARAYLRAQWTVELANDSLLLTRWWDRLVNRPPMRLRVREIQQVVLRRPLFVDFQTTSGDIRVGTFWWRERQFDGFKRLAQDANIRVIQATPDPPGWLRRREGE